MARSGELPFRARVGLCTARSRRAASHALHKLLPPERLAASALDVAEAQQAAADAGAAMQDASTVQQQQPAASSDASSFRWTAQWWPVVPVSYLDPKKPYAVTLLGHSYVVYHDGSSYRVLEDRCPHRLAPLSEGRIEASDGTLMCSYHGWQFKGDGSCTRIPQIGDPERMKTACASPRACVASFPTTVVDGLLFAWLESGPAAQAEAAACQPYNMPEFAGSDVAWGMTESLTDYTFWLEQGMDPTHANFLHHTCGFPMAEALAMPGKVVPDSEISLGEGYTWQHGGYSKKQGLEMQGQRQFVPPNSLRVVYDRGFVRCSNTLATPVTPGASRVFARFAFGDPKAPKKKQPLPMRLFGKLPHWLLMSSPLGDQDSVINAKQEAYMRAQGLTHKDYAAFARADQGVMAAHKWFSAAGYEQMWQQRMGPAAASGEQPPRGARYAAKGYTPAADESAYFSWHNRHVKHCRECQAGLKLVEAAIRAAGVLAAVLVAVAAAAAVAAKSVAAPGAVVAALLAAGAAWAQAQLKDFRHTRFYNTQLRWQRDGGLSLVKGDPIKLHRS